MEQFPEEDIVRDINTWTRAGALGLFDTDQPIDTIPDRLRVAYNYSWQVLGNEVFDESELARPAEEARATVLKLFEHLWKVRYNAELVDVATFAFSQRWTQGSGNMIDAILFEGQRPDAYADYRFVESLRKLCEAAEVPDPTMSAELLLTFGAVVFLTWVFMPQDPGLTPDEAQLGIRNILSGNPPN